MEPLSIRRGKSRAINAEILREKKEGEEWLRAI